MRFHICISRENMIAFHWNVLHATFKNGFMEIYFCGLRRHTGVSSDENFLELKATAISICMMWLKTFHPSPFLNNLNVVSETELHMHIHISKCNLLYKLFC